MTVFAWGRSNPFCFLYKRPRSTLGNFLCCFALFSLYISFPTLHLFCLLRPVSLLQSYPQAPFPSLPLPLFLRELIIITTMATTSTQKNPSKRSREEEMEETPLNRQIPVPKPAIYPNEMYLCRRDEYHDMINHHKAIFYTRATPRAVEVTVGHAL